MTEKQTTILNKRKKFCKNYSAQEFHNCSKAAILKTLIPEISCKTYNIKEFVDYNNANLPDCISEDTAISTLRTFCYIVDDFISRTSDFGCPVPCQQTFFKHKLIYYSKNSWFILDKENRSGNDTFELAVSFDSFDIEEITETFVYDLGSFLTASGGNLGLFMGFSCLSILFAIIHCVRNLFGKHLDQN